MFVYVVLCVYIYIYIYIYIIELCSQDGPPEDERDRVPPDQDERPPGLLDHVMP